jgi:hypothetical protein
MTAPLPPVVNGPVYAVPNVQISADNVLPDALVTVFQNGSEVGAGHLDQPRDDLGSDHRGSDDRGNVTATQTCTGNASYVQATPGVSSELSPFPGHRLAGGQAAARAGLSLWGVPVQRRRLARQPHLRSYQ